MSKKQDYYVICGNCGWHGLSNDEERCPDCKCRLLTRSEVGFAPLSGRANFVLAALTTASGKNSEFVVEKSLEMYMAQLMASRFTKGVQDE